jgi:DnaJ like chaperone protein
MSFFQNRWLTKIPFLGKILGAVIGFIIWKRYGLLIGFALGHLWDKRHFFRRVAGQDRVFYQTLFQLMGYFAKSDGYVSPDEVAAAERFLDQLELTGDARAQAVQAFGNGREDGYQPEAALHAFNARFGLRSESSEKLMKALVAYAHADGPINAEEFDALRKVIASLGFRADELARAQREFAPESAPLSEEAQALQVLGLTIESTNEDIVKAYRKRISSVHPDKLEGQGIRGDALKGAEGKAKEVRSAYDLLCVLRGIK